MKRDPIFAKRSNNPSWMDVTSKVLTSEGGELSCSSCRFVWRDTDSYTVNDNLAQRAAVIRLDIPQVVPVVQQLTEYGRWSCAVTQLAHRIPRIVKSLSTDFNKYRTQFQLDTFIVGVPSKQSQERENSYQWLLTGSQGVAWGQPNIPLILLYKGGQ